MEFKINEEKENSLFNRKEIKGILKSEIAPKRSDVLKLIAEKLNTPEEGIKIKGIFGRFGSHEFRFEANIYPTKKEKDEVEFKKKKEKEYENRLIQQEESKDESQDENKGSEEVSKQESKSEDNESKSDQPEQEKSEEKIVEENKKDDNKEKGEPDKE